MPGANDTLTARIIRGCREGRGFSNGQRRSVDRSRWPAVRFPLADQARVTPQNVWLREPVRFLCGSPLSTPLAWAPLRCPRFRRRCRLPLAPAGQVLGAPVAAAVHREARDIVGCTGIRGIAPWPCASTRRVNPSAPWSTVRTPSRLSAPPPSCNGTAARSEGSRETARTSTAMVR